METCEYCGWPIGEAVWSGKYCDGVLTLDADPFQEEIYNDPTPVWMCYGQRYESSMDI